MREETQVCFAMLYKFNILNGENLQISSEFSFCSKLENTTIDIDYD